jgi:hypothetical protein
MDANNPQLYYVSQKKYTNKNQYDNFTILQGRNPQKEFHAVVIPDYVKLKYSFIIWTDYVAQMNKITEAINYASDSYWGDPERFKFNAKIDTFTNKVEVGQGKNRVVKTDFGLTLQGYIITDAMSAQLAKKPPRFYSDTSISFSPEIVTDFSSPKTREESRKELGEYKKGAKESDGGIGFDGVNNIEIS